MPPLTLEERVEALEHVVLKLEGIVGALRIASMLVGLAAGLFALGIVGSR